jgi:hypothetical protein
MRLELGLFFLAELTLCRRQEQWKRSGKAPAAKVIRTAPKIGVAKKPAMAVDAPPVFEVKERPAPSMQPAPHATSTATAEPKKKRSLFAQQRVNTADALPGSNWKTSLFCLDVSLSYRCGNFRTDE